MDLDIFAFAVNMLQFVKYLANCNDDIEGFDMS